MSFPIDISKTKWVLACLVPLATFFIIFPAYILTHTFFWVCLLTLPISIINDSSQRFPFFGLCLILGGLTLVLPTTIGVYVFVCSLLLFIGQQMMGGIHLIGLIHAFLASPFFTYVSSLVSFPIRLQLSKAVSYLLNYSGIENSTDGNIIHLGNHSFMVDQACSGMYFLGYGMLFGTLILSIRIRTKSIEWKWLVLYYSLLLGLIIWGNLVRIYFLVVFNIGSGHWMHDGIGLIIYLVQILLPFYLILKIGKSRSVKKLNENSPASKFPIFKYALLIVLLVSLFVSVSVKKNEEILKNPVISLNGFDSEVVKKNVTKLHNDHTLIYLKSPVAAYSADHNPMICWSGSGYEFQKVEKITIGKNEVNAAMLKKNSDILYTAWWFESAESKTGDQWDWRWKAINYGENFYLINVTCSTKEKLNHQLKTLLERNFFQQNHENKKH